MIYFGEKLKDLRISANLTQEQLASRVEVGKASISAYENSTKIPSIDVLIKLCHALNISSDYLLGLSDTMQLQKSALTDKQMSIVRQLILEFERNNQ